MIGMCAFCFKDAAPGAPDPDLDQQRNRVVAAAALKQAQALADQGKESSVSQAKWKMSGHIHL